MPTLVRLVRYGSTATLFAVAAMGMFGRRDGTVGSVRITLIATTCSVNLCPPAGALYCLILLDAFRPSLESQRMRFGDIRSALANDRLKDVCGLGLWGRSAE